MEELGKLLNKGLAAGYAGKAGFEKINRGPFALKVSQFPPANNLTENNIVYRDEWIADHTGGGQEIVQIGDKKATRLYAGGTIFLESLANFSLTPDEVTEQLKLFILESEGKTRLDSEYGPISHDDWHYKYRIYIHRKNIPLVIAEETIHFKNSLVFSHGVMITTIE